MAVALAEPETRRLPRANVRNPADPFPDDQYVKVPNVAIFAEHETRTPEGKPQKFDRTALQKLIDRGNERIQSTGDYAAVSIGHTHDPEDGGGEQPEVIGAAGPYRLGMLGNPGTPAKYAILCDFWIRRDKIDKYNAHPRRSVELWYEHDEPAWIDPVSLLTEAPRLDLGLTPLVEAKGNDGAELKYLYSATHGGLRVVKYAAAAPACGNVFVPAEGSKQHYAAESNEPSTEKDNLMLAPEDIRQIADAVEQLDVIAAMREFLPIVPRLQELLAVEDREHAAVGEPGAVPPEDPTDPGATPAAPAVPAAAAEPPKPIEPPAPPAPAPEKPAVPASEKPKEDERKEPQKFSAAEATPKANLEDMSEEEIERYLCDRKSKRYAAAEGSVEPATNPAPAEGTVDANKAKPAEGSAGGEATAAKYSAMEARLAELEKDRTERTNEARKSKLTQLRYHRAFDLGKEVARCDYAKMSDEQFNSHVHLLAEVATPTMANAPLPVPDELLDSAQPAPQVRQGPERYSKEKCEEAARIVYERRQAGREVSYETVLDSLINGRPIPE